jgi:hypothetical protein
MSDTNQPAKVVERRKQFGCSLLEGRLPVARDKESRAVGTRRRNYKGAACRGGGR